MIRIATNCRLATNVGAIARQGRRSDCITSSNAIRRLVTNTPNGAGTPSTSAVASLSNASSGGSSSSGGSGSSSSTQPPPPTSSNAAAAASSIKYAKTSAGTGDPEGTGSAGVMSTRGPVTWPALGLVAVAAASAVAYYKIERERRLENAMGKIVSSWSLRRARRFEPFFLPVYCLLTLY